MDYKNWLKTTYPRFAGYDFLRGLDVLTKLGYVNDERLDDAAQLLMKKRTVDGKWILERSPSRMHAKMETIGKPSKWITLIALRVLKRLNKLDDNF